MRCASVYSKGCCKVSKKVSKAGFEPGVYGPARARATTRLSFPFRVLLQKA